MAQRTRILAEMAQSLMHLAEERDLAVSNTLLRCPVLRHVKQHNLFCMALDLCMHDLRARLDIIAHPV